jgi:hypothetical protein
MALRTPETATPEAIQQLAETNLTNAVRIRDLEAKLADAKRHLEIEESRSKVRGQTALSLTTENELLKAKLAKAEADLNKAIKGLKFYGDKNNWRYKDNSNVGAFDAWLDFKPDHSCKDHSELGGYHARKTLAELREGK